MLAAIAVALLLITAAAAVAVPGVLADPEPDRPIRPGHVGIDEAPAVAPGEISGATAELRLSTRIEHAGNPTPNVSVRFRAFDAESGLLADERTVEMGELTGDRSVPVNGTLRVQREGGYVLETTVFRDGERVDRTTRRVSGMEALKPPYARSHVSFTETEAVPSLAVSVEDAGENRTTLRLTASLTNGGDNASENLRIEFVLRQADSNIEAARSSETVGTIRPGRTSKTATTLTVPNSYNYYVDAVLYRDGVLIDTARSVANLDPTETITANETTREVEFDVEDFEQTDDDDAGDRPREQPTITETSAGGPGFTPVVAVVALLAVALVVRRLET
jgi:PGF-CTERM protein